MNPIARPEDINADFAVRAFEGTSFSPERRGPQYQREYADTVNGLYEELAPLAKTPEAEEILAAEMARFKDNFLKAFNDFLASHSRLVSTMIVGGSNFPVRTMQKRSDWTDNKMRRLIEMREKAEKSIRRKLKAQAVEDAGGEAAVMAAKLAKAERDHERMKAANKIVRNKKLSDSEKVAAIAEAVGISETAAHKLLKPDFCGRVGFPQYMLTNNLANIKRMRQRVVEIEAVESASGVTDLGKGDGFEVVANGDINRVQILFDSKPDEAMRSKLKSHGWRWSPRESAWQRQDTRNARLSAAQILNIETADI